MNVEVRLNLPDGRPVTIRGELDRAAVLDLVALLARYGLDVDGPADAGSWRAGWQPRWVGDLAEPPGEPFDVNPDLL